MSVDFNNVEQKMQKVIEALNSNLTKVRTGRANPAILDSVNVEAYGAPTPINQVAIVSVPEAHQIMVKPFDPSLLEAIESGINNANIGINPNNDGTVIRLNIPALTEEIRKTLVKDVKAIAEDHKVRIRNVRHDAMADIKNDKEMTEDDKKQAETKVQDLTNKFNKNIEEVCANKEKEVMTI